MSCFLWSSSYSQITRWIAKKAGIFAHSLLSVWLAKNNRTKETLFCGLKNWSFLSRLSDEQNQVAIVVGLVSVWTTRSEVVCHPCHSLHQSLCCGNTDDYLTPKALTSNGGPLLLLTSDSISRATVELSNIINSSLKTKHVVTWKMAFIRAKIRIFLPLWPHCWKN